MRLDIERVAEAIWRADINNGHRDFIDEAGVSWSDDIGDEPKGHYRKLAQAAVEALELTEERRGSNEIKITHGCSSSTRQGENNSVARHELSAG